MKRNTVPLILSVVCMLALILDGKTAISGAADGIHACIRAVIPALFPFLIISRLLTSSASGASLPFLQPLGRLLHVPSGMESIVLVGFLGGYPVGAKAVAQAYQDRLISKENAMRMLPFCSNAGPAFLFGLGASLFPKVWLCWLVWLIHILAAIFTAFCIPPAVASVQQRSKPTSISLSQAVEDSIRTMALICGWVVLFRVLISFADRWFLWMLPQEAQVLLIGLLELTNGCLQLPTLTSPGLALMIFSVLLAFGGLCVMMQTQSVLSNCGLSLQTYFPGKVLQALFSLLLSCLAQPLLPMQMRYTPPVILLISAGIGIGASTFHFAKNKKRGGIRQPAVV